MASEFSNCIRRQLGHRQTVRSGSGTAATGCQNAQSRLLEESLADWIRAWDRGACDEPFGRSIAERSALARLRVDWRSQRWRRLHSSLSLAWPHDATSKRCHALGCWVVSSLKSFSSPRLGRRRVNHRVDEQSPGNGRFIRRPLHRADGFAFNTNQRGFKTGSNGREQPAGLAQLESDGPASQSAPRPSGKCFGPNQELLEAPDGDDQSSASYAAQVRRARTAEKLVIARLDFSRWNRLASAKVESTSKISRN